MHKLSRFINLIIFSTYFGNLPLNNFLFQLKKKYKCKFSIQGNIKFTWLTYLLGQAPHLHLIQMTYLMLTRLRSYNIPISNYTWWKLFNSIRGILLTILFILTHKIHHLKLLSRDIDKAKQKVIDNRHYMHILHRSIKMLQKEDIVQSLIALDPHDRNAAIDMLENLIKKSYVRILS